MQSMGHEELKEETEVEEGSTVEATLALSRKEQRKEDLKPSTDKA